MKSVPVLNCLNSRRRGAGNKMCVGLLQNCQFPPCFLLCAAAVVKDNAKLFQLQTQCGDASQKMVAKVGWGWWEWRKWQQRCSQQQGGGHCLLCVQPGAAHRALLGQKVSCGHLSSPAVAEGKQCVSADGAACGQGSPPPAAPVPQRRFRKEAVC